MLTRMFHDNSVFSVAFSPDGKYVLSASSDFTARVWETESGIEVARMTHNSIVYSAAFSPNGKYVVSGSEDFTVRVWEVLPSAEVARIDS